MQLQDRVAIVTGGGRGIGRAITCRFAAEGARVLIAQRDEQSAGQTCGEVLDAGGEAIFVATDVADRGAVERMVARAVEHWGGVQILVNNAARTGENGHFLEIPAKTWEEVIRTNLTGAFHCSQVAARVMARSGGGSIINVSSVNGLVPQPRCAAYGAAKGGLENLTRSMATDLVPFGIRVNTIAPGPIQSRAADHEPPQSAAMALLGRSGMPEEVAALALFLASDQSSYITGERVGVDGGTLVNAYQIYGAPRPDGPSPP
jgi:NAD(P)-dependent dehydrogenase (short-subunit alcohol dehydrogenase family)